MLGSAHRSRRGDHMLRVVSSVALALSLLGCGSAAPPGESVRLLTGDLSCYAGGEGGPTAPLLAEPEYGTSFDGRPVMWPTGYTARRVGTEVVVLDTQGKVKATTGRTYHISHAFALMLIPDDAGSLGFEPANALPAAADCPYHHDFIDCTANPTDSWCQPHELPHGPSPTPPQPPP